jgi:cell wall-associated NlpC family hydrolase
MADGGISGLAVAVAAVGGFLVYAGIKDVPLEQGLREILSGKTPTGRVPVATAQFGSRPIGSTVAGAANTVGSAASGGALVSEARKHLGKKYVFGAIGPNVFDCSGLVVYCLRKTSTPNAPRFVTHSFAAWARSKGWIKVGEADIRSGDVVLKSGHMGIAISNAEMIHAPHTGTVVKIGKIYSPRYMWSGWRQPIPQASASESRRAL